MQPLTVLTLPAGDNSISGVLAFAIAQLSECSPSAKVDAQLLLCAVIDQNTTYLFTWPEKPLQAEQLEQYLALVVRRQLGEPVAYLTGERGFWTLNLATNRCTLIPRADTECLIECVLGFDEGVEGHGQISAELPDNAKILDLGTGTGAIALALASEKPQWQTHACDVNVNIVALAQQNARQNGINGVTIVLSHWFSAYEADHLASFDLIISNPPYIDKDDVHLQQGDVRFEPTSALVADQQGLADIIHIVTHARRFLKSGGWLMIEHGFEQGELVRDIYRQQGFARVITKKDLSDNDRFTIGSR